MCGAALVGVGYAYNAAYQTPEESISADVSYVTIDIGDTKAFGTSYSLDVKFDTLIDASGKKYVAVEDDNNTKTVSGATCSVFIGSGNTITVTPSKTTTISSTLNYTYNCIATVTGMDNAVYSITDDNSKYAGKIYLGYTIGEGTEINKVTSDQPIPMGSENTITFHLVFESTLDGNAPDITGYDSYKEVSKFPTVGPVNVGVQLLFSVGATVPQQVQ